VFYPFAFSGVCTGELQELRDHVAGFSDATVSSRDLPPHMFSIGAFADRDGDDVSSLSDFWPHGGVASAYGVSDDERGSARRRTVIVDRGGLARCRFDIDISDLGSLSVSSCSSRYALT
jgi:peroxiredoxin